MTDTTQEQAGETPTSDQPVDQPAAPRPKPKRISDIVAPGKPVLISGSGPVATQVAKETAWTMGLEPIVIDLDVLPADLVESEFRGTSPGSFVIMSEMQDAPEDVRERVKSVMRDPERTVVVAVRAGEKAKGIDPHSYDHWINI